MKYEVGGIHTGLCYMVVEFHGLWSVVVDY